MAKLPPKLAKMSKKDLEGLCVDCGVCCWSAIKMHKGSVFVPELRCKYLEIDKGTSESRCSIYNKRHEIAKNWCLPLADAIAKSVFPNQCPYVKDLPDYQGSQPLSPEAYDFLRPKIRKALIAKGQPQWVSDSDWDHFAGLEKSHKYVRREGTKGDYKYYYADPPAPMKVGLPKKMQAKKKEIEARLEQTWHALADAEKQLLAQKITPKEMKQVYDAYHKTTQVADKWLSQALNYIDDKAAFKAAKQHLDPDDPEHWETFDHHVSHIDDQIQSLLIGYDSAFDVPAFDRDSMADAEFAYEEPEQFRDDLGYFAPTRHDSGHDDFMNLQTHERLVHFPSVKSA